jgi:uncharacterized protein (DUF2141 family)
MKHLVFILIIAFSLGASSQSSRNIGTLNVIFTNFEENGKFLQIALYDSESNWLKTPIRGIKQLVDNGKISVTFEELPYGEYAISCFYDINNNNNLDTNFIGIPKEPYSFSNNARTTFGPPSWKKVSFSINNKLKNLSIQF